MFNLDSNEKQFTAADMVSFGKYLLSKERSKRLTPTLEQMEQELATVHHADMTNWIDGNKRAE